jgi:hypothetical protein
MMLFPRGKGLELCALLSFGGAGSAREGEMRGASLEFGLACSESHVPCGLIGSQERVDTGTSLFCPVVVASKGSSLNHSA